MSKFYDLHAKAWDACSELRGQCPERLLCRVEEYMAEVDAEMERHDKELGDNATICSLEATIVSLKDQLAEAKAAAFQWLTYDGTHKTLPKQQQSVLLKLSGGDRTITAYWLGTSRMWRLEKGFVAGMETGDRWAYLPTPPAEDSE